jgi:copper homeostasis protein CutC
MWQYAVCRTIAEKLNYEWGINPSPSHDYFNGESQMKFMNVDFGKPVEGILNEYHEIDYENVYRMVKFAGFLNVVFHKAIDMVEKPYKEIRKLADVGVTRILTSGGEKRAVDGIDTINRMVDEGNKYGIEIVVAGGVTKQNLNILKAETIANAFHGKKIVGNLIEEMEEL